MLITHFSRDHRYMTLKVHINALASNRELEVYQYLKGIESDHPGREMIRILEDSFKLQGPYGAHDVFVLPALGLSLKAFQDTLPGHILRSANRSDSPSASPGCSRLPPRSCKSYPYW